MYIWIYTSSTNPIGRHQQLTAKVPIVMYFAAITWKAHSGRSEDNPGLNGSMPGVDELFKSGIMFDNIRSESLLIKRNLNGMGMLYNTCSIIAVRSMLRYTSCIDEHQTFMADSPSTVLTTWSTSYRPTAPGPRKVHHWSQTPKFRKLCPNRFCQFLSQIRTTPARLLTFQLVETFSCTVSTKSAARHKFGPCLAVALSYTI